MTSWKHAQALTHQFWKRLLREYLPTLSQRRKWTKPTENLQPGDLVWNFENLTPRGL